VACIGERIRAYWVPAEKLKENTHFQNLGVDGRIILEKISKISVGRA